MTASLKIRDKTDTIVVFPLQPGFYELDDAIEEIVKRTGAPLSFACVALEVADVRDLATFLLDKETQAPVMEVQHEIGMQLSKLCDNGHCYTSLYSPRIRASGGTINDSLEQYRDGTARALVAEQH